MTYKRTLVIMDKIKIGYDLQAQQLDRKNAIIKERYYQSLTDFFQKYELQFDEVSTDYRYIFIDQFEIKHSKNYPSFLTVEKMLSLSGVDLSELMSLERNYRSIQPTDTDKDYTIFATTQPQIEAVYLSRKLICSINDFEGYYGNIPQRTYNDLCKAFNGLITTDKQTSERIINVLKIKGL